MLYEHRSTVIHSLVTLQPNVIGLETRSSVLPVVPMFHANSWGIVYSAPIAGAKLVLPGAKMDGASIYELLDSENVDISAGVPTVWLMLLQYCEKEKKILSKMNKTLIGGSAVPRSMIEAF